jgi:hypothetical protein
MIDLEIFKKYSENFINDKHKEKIVLMMKIYK